MKYPSLLLYIALVISFLGASSCGQDDSASKAKDYELAALANAKLNPQIVSQTVTTIATQVVNTTYTNIAIQPYPMPPVVYTVTATSGGTSTATRQ